MDDSSQLEVEHLKKKILSITASFLTELGRERILSMLTMEASFERDLGIDSLGRVELFHRIEEAFDTQFQQDVMIQANCLNDLLQEVTRKGAKVVLTKDILAREITETKFDPSRAHTLVEVLIHRAKKEPNRHHIFLHDQDGQETLITYGDLYEKAKVVSAGLCAKGIKAGDTVALMLPTEEHFFYIFFGILLLGAIPVPIYPPLRPDRIEEYALRESNILKNAEVKLLVTFDKAQRLSELLQVFISSLKAVVTYDMLIETTIAPTFAKVTGNMPALIQYTSGSTSLPKGVLLTHENLLANIRAAGQAMAISPNDFGVSWLPLYHDMGLIGAWFINFYHGTPVVIMSPLTFLTRPDRWLWAIHKHRATFSGAPNFAYELCVRRVKDADLQGLDLSSWRLTFNGAEAIKPSTMRSFIKKFAPYGLKPEAMYPVYGLAESCVALTFPEPGQPPKVDRINREIFEMQQRAVPATEDEVRPRQIVCCGKPIPGHEIRIMDHQNQELEERHVGRLQFKGPSSMVGYYRQVEATNAIKEGDWIDSGDLAYLAEGELYVTGRSKDIIIKAGRNLYPDEIEEVAAQVDGVRKGCVVVFGVSDKRQGTEKIVIVAETKENSRAKKQSIRHSVMEKMAIVLGIAPDEIILAKPGTITKTSSGKLQRSACKQAYLQKTLQASKLPVWMQISKLFFKGRFTQILDKIKLCLSAVYTVYAWSVFLLGTCLMLLTLLFPSRLAAKLLKGFSRSMLLLAFCPIRVTGKEHLESAEPTVYIANHTSYIDTAVLLALLPSGVRFVAKKELKSMPIVGAFIKKLKHITVDRVEFAANLSDTHRIIDTLKKRHSILIFPEGTFTYAAGLRPFKMGAFKVAVETNHPICPIALRGTREIWRDESWLMSPGTIHVTASKRLHPLQKEWEEIVRLQRLSRTIIAKNAGEMELD